MKGKKRKFSKEFKEEAVKLLLSSDKPSNQIASELGIGVSTLEKWKRTIRPEVVKSKSKSVLCEIELQLLQHKREIDRLKKENEILKKAAAFFAREQL